MCDIEKICGSVYADSETTELLEGAKLIRLPNVGKGAYIELKSHLSENGAALYTENELDGNAFSTFTYENCRYTVYFTPCDGDVRIVSEPLRALPAKDETKYESVASPLLTQLKLTYINVDCGMSYLIRLSDGRMVLIDGGYDDYEESERLYDHIKEQNVLPDRPVIAAWFFTHPHSDHVRAFIKLCEDHSDDVILERVIYNFASSEIYTSPFPKEQGEFLAAVASLTKTEKIIARSGDVFRFADATFTVLAVCEDLCPDETENINNSSIVFMMELCGRKVLWLGDGLQKISNIVTSRYSKETIKCDYLQVGHHGYRGGSPLLYETADPSVLLWPCPDFRYQSISLWSCNDFIRTSENVKNIYISGHADSVTNMATGETSYMEDVSLPYMVDIDNASRIVDLGFDSATAAATELVPTAFSFGKDGDGRYVEMSTGGKSIPGLIHGFLLDKAEKVRVKIGAKRIGKDGVFCIMANNPTPTEEDENTVFCASTDGEKHEYDVVIDRKSAAVSLYTDGSLTETRKFEKAESAGIFFVLENAKIRLYSLSAEKEQI